LAWTGPNRLLILMSSMAGSDAVAAAPESRCESASPCAPSEVTRVTSDARAGAVRHVVVDCDLARDDLRLQFFDLGSHIGGDQVLVVLVDRIAHTVLGEAENGQARLE